MRLRETFRLAVDAFQQSPVHKKLVKAGWEATFPDTCCWCYGKTINGYVYWMSSILDGLYEQQNKVPDEDQFDFSKVYVMARKEQDLETGNHDPDDVCENVTIDEAFAAVTAHAIEMKELDEACPGCGRKPGDAASARGCLPL